MNKRIKIRESFVRLNYLYVAVNQFSYKEKPIIVKEYPYYYGVSSYKPSFSAFLDQDNNLYNFSVSKRFWYSEAATKTNYPHFILYRANKKDLRQYWPLFVAGESDE